MPEAAPKMHVVAGRIVSRDEVADESIRSLLDEMRATAETTPPKALVIGTVNHDGTFDLDLVGRVDTLELLGLLEIAKHDLLRGGAPG